MNIVFVPFHDYKLCQKEGFRTRDAHFLKSFEDNPEVGKILVVNRPTSLIELLAGRKKLRTKGDLILKEDNCYLTQVSEKVFCADFLIFDVISVVLKKRMWVPKGYSHSKVSSFYNKCLKYLDLKPDVGYTSTPLTYPFFINNKFNYTIFDAVDNLLKYTIFSKSDKAILESFYTLAIERSDLFICNSQDSFNYFNGDRYNNILLMPNGVNPVEFSKPAIDVPDDLKSISKPIIGYGGKMQVMFDKELLKHLSAEFPDISFVLVGQFLDKEYMNEVTSIHNVYYLGDKNYEDYKTYLKNFDVCMIPYRVETQHGGDPIKFYEYMATNKPIVSTEIGEIKKFESEDIFIVNSHDEFVQAIKKSLTKLKGNTIDREIPKDVTWKYKTETLLNYYRSKQ